MRVGMLYVSGSRHVDIAHRIKHVQLQTSELIPGQSNREMTSFWVACIPECESPRIESNTIRHQGSGNRGRCVPVDVSQ